MMTCTEDVELCECGLLSIADTAELLGVREERLRRWIDEGKISAVNLSRRRIWIHQDAIDAFREAKRPVSA